ncbi:MAG: hypothetical protein IGS23_09900 [Rivularia sp. T60_A2020_040]|nr:hypothetical protein [Rivularia sp. T60_A2020_040]
MSLNLKKVAVAAVVLVSTLGFSVESAKAQVDLGLLNEFFVVEHSGNSDFKDEDEEQQLRASFNIVTDKSFDDAIEDFSLTNSSNGTTLFTSAIGRIEQRELFNEESELQGFLHKLGLNEFRITRDDVFAKIPNGEEPIVAYVVDLTNHLNPNEQAKLALFYDENNASPMQPGGLEGLVSSPQGVVRYAGTETVPGVLIRDSRDGLDNPDQVINGRTVDLFGVGVEATASVPFSVKVRELNRGAVTVPEPTGYNGLLIAGAFGGLFILQRNRRVKKFQGSIDN